MRPEEHVQNLEVIQSLGLQMRQHPFSFHPRKALEVKIDVYFVIYCPIL